MTAVTLFERAKLSRVHVDAAWNLLTGRLRADAGLLVVEGPISTVPEAADDVAEEETAEQTGAMVALVPSVADARRLAVAGGEPVDELHVTLFYLGTAADIPADVQQAIIDALEAAVNGLELDPEDVPLAAEGFAVSVFNPGDANDRETCIVLGLSGQELDEVHGLVAEALAGVTGLVVPDQHAPYAPHVTLIYTDDVSRVEELTGRVGPITFDRLRVAFGGQITDIPLLSDATDEPEVPVPALFARARASRDVQARLEALVAGAIEPVYDVSRMPPQLRKYWLSHEAWAAPGAFTKCTEDLRGHGVPGHMVDGACANLHHEATGVWPGHHVGGRHKGAVETPALAARVLAHRVRLNRFDPEQLRGDDGQWVDIPGRGALAAADKLKLGKLAPAGFSVRSSRKLKTDFSDVGIAEVDSPGGPQVRIGLPDGESGKWDAGFVGEDRKAKLRQEIAQKQTLMDSDAADVPHDIEDQIGELQNELDALENQRTAVLTPEAMADFRRRLGEASVLAKANKVKQDAVGEELDAIDAKRAAVIAQSGDAALENEIDKKSSTLYSREYRLRLLRQDPAYSQHIPEAEADVAAAERELAPLLAQRARQMVPDARARLEDLDRQRSALNDEAIDDMLTSVEAPAPNGGRLLAEVWGSDDGDTDWVTTRLYVLRPGETTEDADNGDDYAYFRGLKELNKLVGGLDAGGGGSSVANRLMVLRDKFDPSQVRDPDGKWTAFGGVAAFAKELLAGDGKVSTLVDRDGVHLDLSNNAGGSNKSGALAKDDAFELGDLLERAADWNPNEDGYPREGDVPEMVSEAVHTFTGGPDDPATGFAQVSHDGTGNIVLELRSSGDKLKLTRSEAKSLADTMHLAYAVSRVETKSGLVDVFPTEDRKVGLRLYAADGTVVEPTFDGKSWTRLGHALNAVWEGYDEREEFVKGVPTVHPDFAGDPNVVDYPDVDSLEINTSAGRMRVWRTGDVHTDVHAPEYGTGTLSFGPVDGSWTVARSDSYKDPLVDAFQSVEQYAGYAEWRGFENKAPRIVAAVSSGLTADKTLPQRVWASLRAGFVESQIRRDRKGRFATISSKQAVEKLDKAIEHLHGLGSAFDAADEDHADVLKTLQRTREHHHKIASAPHAPHDYDELETKNYHNVSLDVDAVGDISVDFDEEQFWVENPHIPGLIAAARAAQAVPVPPGKHGDPGYDSGEVLHRAVISTDLQVLKYRGGETLIGDVDGETSILELANDAELTDFADILEELYDTAAHRAAQPRPSNVAGQVWDAFDESKVKRDGRGKFAKKAGEQVKEAVQEAVKTAAPKRAPRKKAASTAKPSAPSLRPKRSPKPLQAPTVHRSGTAPPLKDLFPPTDRETTRADNDHIEAVMRQAIAGDYPGGLRIDDVYAHHAGGGPGASRFAPRGFIQFSGTVKDADGNQVGHFRRDLSLRPNEDDPSAPPQWIANHDKLFLDPDVQGAGFARAFNGNMLDWYRRSGVDYVELGSGGEVGGYAWPAQGFDFKNRADLDRFYAEGLRDPSLAAGFTPEKLAAQAPLLEAVKARVAAGEWVSAYELSQLGRGPGQGKDDWWIGKAVLIGGGFSGRLAL